MEAPTASRWKNQYAGLMAAVVLFSGAAAAWADTADAYFITGEKLFKKGQYKQALSYFKQSNKAHPFRSDTIYYQALTCQHLGDTKGATTLYSLLVKNYSYCDAGKLAARALLSLNPTLYGDLRRGAPLPRQAPASNVRPGVSTSAVSDSSEAELRQLPPEARVYFEPVGGSLMMDATVNSRAIKMVFDTGATGCVFGMNHLRDLNITPPDGPPTAQTGGVGSTGGIDTWMMDVNLKVGTIERKNFRIFVQRNLPTPPLLGQTFFRDFQYTIDNGAKNVHFIRKSGRTSNIAAGDRNAVPFKRHGNNIIVDVDVNGHTVTMFFDTGASGILFTTEQLRKADLSVPEDAQSAISGGVGGAAAGYTFPVSRMRLGPIEKTNIMIQTTDNAGMPYPLLGQTFFGDWQYTIDSDNSVLRFVRR